MVTSFSYFKKVINVSRTFVCEIKTKHNKTYLIFCLTGFQQLLHALANGAIRHMKVPTNSNMFLNPIVFSIVSLAIREIYFISCIFEQNVFFCLIINIYILK